MALVLADTYQLLNTWSQLRQLLIFLDRLRLRRTFSELRGLYGGSVWKLSGNVLEERYRLLSRQFESARHLHNALAQWTIANATAGQDKHIAIEQMEQCEKQGRKFATWYVDLLNDEIKDTDKEYNIRPLTEFQGMLAATAGCILKHVVLPSWQTETESLIRCPAPTDKKKDSDTAAACMPAHVRAAEEFVVLPLFGLHPEHSGTSTYHCVQYRIAVCGGDSGRLVLPVRAAASDRRGVPDPVRAGWDNHDFRL
jgi:hypothetical protein